ncbi:hypothetical protein [Endozoicomonas sp. 4G]|uniref:hypothetical protein n=1 Tax=Endozoicomonas sp. 4G TaxID=2872754 RepID=UPI002078C2C5|nr:hypothetical protein [Endozoicomonas sp. 4G]
MLSKKLLILTLVIAFSVHCPNGRAQENRLPLRFALAVSKALINAPKPFIEVLSIKGIYVTGVETILLPLFPFRDGLPDEQESEAIESWELKVHSRAASDDSAYSEDSDSEANSTSDKSSDNRSNEDEDEGEANAESDVRYETTTVNPFRVANETSQYCTTLVLKKIKQELVSDSEIATNGTSDESIDNRSDEDESDARYVTTTLNPFRVSDEISQYGAILELRKIKEEPVSGSEILTGSEEEVTKVDAPRHQCDHEGCDYKTKWSGDLKRHKQIHLPADQRPKVYHCDYEGCDYSVEQVYRLKRHKQTHLPADQRPNRSKIHQCDHEDCNYSTDQACNMKRHKQTHLPADQRPKRAKVHQCDHEGCDFSTNRAENLKGHKQTHLPADQRPKVHQCDHEGCDYSTGHLGNLKMHKQTHLPADQRLKIHQCDHEGCNYSTDHLGNLKTHKNSHLPAHQRPQSAKVHQCNHEGCNYRTGDRASLRRHKQKHLPADQRLKRKACDQPPSNAKRKKGDKE